MSHHLTPYRPKPSGWFLPEIEYRGWGTAEFADPAGVVEGPVEIHADGRGVLRIEMGVQAFSPSEILPLGLLQFLALTVTATEEGKTTLGIRRDLFKMHSANSQDSRRNVRLYPV